MTLSSCRSSRILLVRQRRDSDRLSATHFDRTNCAEDAATVLAICRTDSIILGFCQTTLVKVPIETIRVISR